VASLATVACDGLTGGFGRFGSADSQSSQLPFLDHDTLQTFWMAMTPTGASYTDDGEAAAMAPGEAAAMAPGEAAAMAPSPATGVAAAGSRGQSKLSMRAESGILYQPGCWALYDSCLHRALSRALMHVPLHIRQGRCSCCLGGFHSRDLLHAPSSPLPPPTCLSSSSSFVSLLFPPPTCLSSSSSHVTLFLLLPRALADLSTCVAALLFAALGNPRLSPIPKPYTLNPKLYIRIFSWLHPFA